jgi:polyisoprenyl-phosphate glycosyltransferase
MKKISIISPTFNESENVRPLTLAILEVIAKEKDYSFEHIFIDNASTDDTVLQINSLIDEFTHVGLIVNNRNFGQIRSPFHALTLTESDATIQLCADLQEPPALIHQFLRKWEEGALVVGGVKESSDESKILYFIRGVYYKLLAQITEHPLVSQFTGFGLYDKIVINEFKGIADLYPYSRGLISDLGFDVQEVSYHQEKRKFGVSKNNFLSLFDLALVGMISNSKLPIRLATIIGFLFSIFSFTSGVIYLTLKLLFWDIFEFGLAPLLIIISFGFSIIIFFLGIMGEYIGSIHSEVLKRPRVVERTRNNYPVLKPFNENDC